MKRLGILVALLLVLLPASSQAQGLSVVLSPREGPPGTVITISGTAPRNADVEILILPWGGGDQPCELYPGDGFQYVSAKANGSGRYTATYTAEKIQAGIEGRIIGARLLGDLALPRAECFRFTVTNSRYFPETGHTVSGRFLEIWEINSGLSVYGYPITDAQNELNVDTGEEHLTQWFERNRLELHPENRSPYDVQLGRLGDDRLRQLGRDWRKEGRERGPKAGCIWFSETGHNVCNQLDPFGVGLYEQAGFAQFWRSGGFYPGGLAGDVASLAGFGLPLTEAKMETNSSGDTVLTQWFERARFEWHPDNDPFNRVQLGLLGREVKGLP